MAASITLTPVPSAVTSGAPGMYTRGEELELRWSVKDTAGVLTEPDALTFTVRSPDGVDTEYVMGSDSEITNDEDGTGTLILVLDQSARWFFRCETDTPTTAAETDVIVQRSALEDAVIPVPGDPGAAFNGAIARAASGVYSPYLGTEVGETLTWNGSIWVKRRGWFLPDVDTTGVADARAAIMAGFGVRNGMCVELPEGEIRIASPIAMVLNGLSLVGRGDYATTLILDGAANQDWITMANLSQRLTNIRIVRASMSSAVPSGFAVKLDGCFGATLDRLWLEQVENGIRVKNSTDSFLGRIKLRSIFGATGVKVDGAASANNQTLIDAMRTDNGYFGGYPSVATGVVDWSSEATVAEGDIVVVASVLCWQVSTAGDLGTTNATLTSLPSSDPDLARSTAVANGSAQLKYIGRSDLDWIFWDSYGGDLEVRSSAFLNGGRGIRQDDTQSAGTPNIGKFVDVEIDHPLVKGVDLIKGSDVTLRGVAAGSCLRGTGIDVGAAFGKDFRIENCRVIGNAEHGVAVVNAGWGTVHGCQIGHNGQKASDTYDGVVTGAVTRLSINNNHSGDLRDIGNPQRYGINVGGSSTYYSILGNVCLDNVTGAVSHPSGTGAQVADNVTN